MTVAPILAVVLLAASPCDPDRPQTLVEKVLRITGLDASAKGPGDPGPAGDLYAVPVAGKDRQRLTRGQALRSPVFTADDHLVALDGDRLVRVDLGGDLRKKPRWIADVPGAVRLAGVAELAENDAKLLVALARDGEHYHPVVVCLPIRHVVPLAEVEGHEELDRLLPRLRSAERRYGGLLLRDQPNDEGGHDVHRIEGDETANLSRCGPDTCTQGALSPNRKIVAYVKTTSKW